MTTEIDPSEDFLKNFLQLIEPIAEISRFINSIADHFNRFAPTIRAILESPNVRFWISVHRCETVPHPVYWEVLDSEFSENDIRKNWRQIRQSLWHRFPRNLDTESRKERYNQILKCQTIGAYTAVCRSIYAEIEALLRDELLIGNNEWLELLKEKSDPQKRRSFQNSELRKIINQNHQKISILKENEDTSNIPPYAYFFLDYLKESFESFDPIESVQNAKKSFRHIHAHGWKKNASFIDGLNGILAFDILLELLAEPNTQVGSGR